ncbi:MAG: peptidase inhibitor family I36 protein [Candidatus Delongbacteria bacterium]|nr:peptidase inhibitor family I36 protein [Candidatus Delongbacteria bacterium]
MQKFKMSLISLVVLLIGVLGVNSTVYAENIDLNKYLKNKLIKHEAKISQDLFGNDYYKIESVKFKGDLDADLKLEDSTLPQVALITTIQVSTNKGTSDIQKEFDFSVTEEESYEVTNSKTINTGVSATVSAEIPFTSAGISSTFSLDVETSKSETKGKMKSHTWTDVTSYTVKPGITSTAQFIIKGSKAERVPYTGNVKVSGAIEVTMKVPGRVYLYEDMHYKGWKQYFHAGDHVKFWKKYNDEMSSVKVEKGLSITVYKDAHYKGTHHTYTKDVSFVGKSFNDQLSSFKVGGKGTKTIQLTDYLNVGECSIEVSGSIKAAQGVKSYVSVTEQPADSEESTANNNKVLRGKNAKVIPGGKIISTKSRK